MSRQSLSFHGDLGDLLRRFRPPPGTAVLMAITAVLSLFVAMAPDWSGVLIINPHTFNGTALLGLATNAFINLGASVLMLLVFAAIAAFLFQDQLRWWWQTRRRDLLIAVAGVAGALFVLSLLVPGIWGLVTALLILWWFATPVEQRWGARRLWIFSGIIVIATNLVGAILLAIAGQAAAAPLMGSDAMSAAGIGALVDAILTAWCTMVGKQRLAILNIQARTLIWLLVAINVLDILFVSVVTGLMGLAAIGLARALIDGVYHPRYVFDHLHLSYLRARRIWRTRKFQVFDGGKGRDRNGSDLH